MYKRPLVQKAIEYHGGVKNLSEELNCSRGTIYRWLNCKRNYSPKSAKSLSIAVDGLISPEAFMGDLVKFPRKSND